MKILNVKLLILLVVCLIIPNKSEAQDTFGGSKESGYNRYCNSRFGFCVDYPKSFNIDRPPANGDGRRFFSGNFEMIASGIHNVPNESLNNAMEDSINNSCPYHPELTYRNVGSNFFVISGFCGDIIFYQKSYVGRGQINSLYLKYPRSQKQRYDGTVNQLSRSFTPGPLN